MFALFWSSLVVTFGRHLSSLFATVFLKEGVFVFKRGYYLTQPTPELFDPTYPWTPLVVTVVTCRHSRHMSSQSILVVTVVTYRHSRHLSSQSILVATVVTCRHLSSQSPLLGCDHVCRVPPATSRRLRFHTDL